MFAVIKTGGKQYKVAKDDVITIERLEGTAGDDVAFETVLMFSDGKVTQIGKPTLGDVTVAGTLVEQDRGPKVISFKKRRRKNSRRKKGHRQDLSIVKITDILTGGKKPELKKAPKVAASEEAAPKAKKAAAKAEGETKKAPAKKPAAKKTVKE